MALAGDSDAPPTRRIAALAQPASVAPPSIRRGTLKDGLLAKFHPEKVPPAPSGSARKKGTGG